MKKLEDILVYSMLWGMIIMTMIAFVKLYY